MLVVFTCNSCPVAVGYEGRIAAFAKAHAGTLAVVAINVNTGKEDALPAMTERAAKKNFPFAYLYDPTQEIARRYGAKYTPEFFLLDSNQRREAFAPGGEQYAWLDKALGQSQATWKFVAHHHDPYSPDDDDHGDAWSAPSTLGDEHVRQIVPVLERHNVDVVFFGHLHTYMRSRPIRGGRVAADGVRCTPACVAFTIRLASCDTPVALNCCR